MSNIATVTLTKNGGTNTNAPLPAANAAFEETVITVTDGAGAVQTASVNGTENPQWTAVFNNVASGSCNASAQDTDVNNAPIGPAIAQTFTMPAAVTPPPPATYPQTTAISVATS